MKDSCVSLSCLFCLVYEAVEDVDLRTLLFSQPDFMTTHVALQYRGADKSLARPGRKQATFPSFYGTWRFITTFTRVHHLSLP